MRDPFSAPTIFARRCRTRPSPSAPRRRPRRQSLARVQPPSTMTLAEFLAEVVRQLEDASIDYMIGGSVASSTYGEPRTTRDVDIVVEVTQASLRSLFGAVDRSVVYIDEPPVGQPITAGQMFNLVDLRGGWRVDLIVRKARPFSEVEFAGRRELVGPGRRARSTTLAALPPYGAAFWTSTITVDGRRSWGLRTSSNRCWPTARDAVAMSHDEPPTRAKGRRPRL